MIGLEPTRRKAPDPKSGMATNYITSATCRENNSFLKSIKQKKARIFGFRLLLQLYVLVKLFNLHFFSNTVLFVS